MKKGLLIICYFIAQFSYGQDSLMSKFSDISSSIYKDKPVNYLKGLRTIKDNEAYFLGTNLESFYYQMEGAFYSRMGDYDKAREYYLRGKGIEEFATIDLKNKKISNAKEEILNRALISKVVMINENHVLPEHRVFTTSLLKGMYDRGFRYLALEDLADKGDSLNSREYLIVTDGLHLNEVMFGNMARMAKSIGYTLIPYDNNDAWDNAERDSLGAVELKKVFDKDPNAKMLVHCGLAHIRKDKKMLAFFIKRDLRIDPLTINQINFSSGKDLVFDTPMVIEQFGISTDTKYSIGADIQVVHPIYNRTKNRPNYIFENNRVIKTIDLTDFKRDNVTILEVRRKSEKLNAIPLDRVVIDKDDLEISVSSEASGTKALIKNDINQVVMVIDLDK